jgi:hypothetical protein
MAQSHFGSMGDPLLWALIEGAIPCIGKRGSQVVGICEIPTESNIDH